MKALLWLISIAGLFMPPGASAAAYPERPVRLIVGFPPGAAADILGRIAAQRLTESLAQQVVVDNRGGAGGLIATEIAARANPDGYTLLFTSILALAGTPKAVITRINRELNAALASPELKKRLAAQGADAVGGTSEEFGKRIRADLRKVGPGRQGVRRPRGLRVRHRKTQHPTPNTHEAADGRR